MHIWDGTTLLRSLPRDRGPLTGSWPGCPSRPVPTSGDRDMPSASGGLTGLFQPLQPPRPLMAWHTFSLCPVTQHFSVSFIYFSNSPTSGKPVSLVQPQKRITASGKSEHSPVPPDTPQCQIRVVGKKWACVDMKGWLSGNRPQAVPASCPELPGTRGPCRLPGAPQHAGPLQVPVPSPHCREEHLNLGCRARCAGVVHPLAASAADCRWPWWRTAHGWKSTRGFRAWASAGHNGTWPASLPLLWPCHSSWCCKAGTRAHGHWPCDTLGWPGPMLLSGLGGAVGLEQRRHRTAGVPLCWILGSVSYAIFFFSK